MTGTRTIEGVIPILVTPFDEAESVDLDALGRELDFLADRGVEWVGFGFGSEVHRLDPAEVADVVAYAVERSTGRLEVIANVDMPSTRAAIAAARRAADAGASAAMVRASGLAGTPPDALFDAYVEVAQEGGVPIVVQDAPAMTGLEIPAQVLARLLTEAPNVAAVKVEPTPSAPKISQLVALLAGAPAAIIGGLGGVDFIHELERGATGTMPGPAFPELFITVRRLHQAGDRAAARRLFSRLLPLITLSGRTMDTFLFAQKHLLMRRGVLAEPRLRSPHGPIDARLPEELDALLADLEADGILTARER